MVKPDQAIAEHVAETLPPRIKRLGRLAMADLVWGCSFECEDCGERWNGCTCEDPFPGFESACRELREYFRDLGTLYYEDWSGCVLTSEPEGYEDEETGDWVDPEPYYAFGPRDVVRAVFGKELAEYV